MDNPVEREGGRPSMLVVATVAATLSSFLIPYAEHFRKAGWRVDAAANGATTSPAVLGAFESTFEVPLSRSVRDVRAILTSYRAIEATATRGYDIVHVHTPIAAFLTRLAIHRSPEASRPAVVYTAHGFHFHAGGDPVTNQVFVTAERIAGRWTDRMIVINSADAAAARRYRLVPDSRLIHMPGIGIDTGWFARSAVGRQALEGARSGLGIPADAPMFVVVAELSRRKRPLDVVAAAALMRDSHSHVVFLGDGPERAEVASAIREAGLDGRVHLVGVMSDVRPMVASATALVLASSREGLPRSIMEALSLEVPVIATNARGNADLVEPDGGLIVPIGDVGSLAAAMDALAGDADRRTAMGQAGRTRMVSQYDVALTIRSHELLYDELIANAQRDRTRR